MELGSYEREHAVRYCRERCIEQGYYGSSLEYCIKMCVEEIRGSVKR